MKYTGPVSLRNGGTISAWTKENDWLVASQTFSRIESIPLSVVFASSQESGEGDASHLTDGIQAATGTQCTLLLWLTTHTGLTSIVVA